jgi:hypothetical protein
VEIAGVHGKGNGIVRIGGVYEAVCVGGWGRHLTPFVNFAVNCIETNSIVTFAENYFDSDERRLIWIWDYRKSDNFKPGRHLAVQGGAQGLHALPQRI